MVKNINNIFYLGKCFNLYNKFMCASKLITTN